MPPAQGTKRLSDCDVQEIFSCLYEHGKRPPPQLSFVIVPVVRDLRRIVEQVDRLLRLLILSLSHMSYIHLLLGPKRSQAVTSIA